MEMGHLAYRVPHGQLKLAAGERLVGKIGSGVNSLGSETAAPAVVGIKIATTAHRSSSPQESSWPGSAPWEILRSGFRPWGQTSLTLHV